MRICIIGPKESQELMRIKKAAEDRGHECKRIFMNDVYFEANENGFQAVHRKLDLLEFDLFLFRSVKKFFRDALLLAEYLHGLGKIVVDESLATQRFISIRNSMLLCKAGIPQIELVQTNGLKASRDVLMEIGHPITIQSVDEKGKEIHTVSEDWTDSYDFVRTSKIKNFVFYRFVDAESFIKVFIIGTEVIGGIRQKFINKEHKQQFPTPFKTQNLDLNEELKMLALKAVKAINFEIASVDILEDKGKSYVMNVNRAPKYSAFEKATKIDFAQKVVEYLEKKQK